MPQIGLAELRHARVHVWPHGLPIEQNLAQPFRPQLGAHAVERWRNAARVSQPFLVRAKVLEHRVAHAARAIARMAGRAIKRRHRVLNLLSIRQRLFNSRQRLANGLALRGGQMKIRHAIRLLSQTSFAGRQLGHRQLQLRFLIRQLVARRAVQAAEHHLARLHFGRIGLQFGDSQFLRPQQKCRNGARLVAGEIHVRHPPIRSRVPRLKEEGRQRIQPVLGRHMLQPHTVARRVARDAAHLLEQFFALAHHRGVHVRARKFFVGQTFQIIR